MNGSTLAPKSCSTPGELRQHECEEKQQHAAGGTEHEQRIADGITEPAFQRLGPASFVGKHF